MAILVWIFTFFLLLLLPLLFLLPYAVHRGISPATPDYARVLTDFALKDPTAIFLQVLATLPTHLLTFVVVWAVVTRFGKLPFWETIGGTWGRRLGLPASIGLGVILFILSAAIAHVLGGDKPTQLDAIINSSPASRYLLVFLATFTAPFAEEFIYRGLLYSSMQRLLGRIAALIVELPSLQRLIGRIAAVIVVLAMFTMVHVPQYWPNFGVIAAVGLLSIVLTIVRAYSGRLLPCIVIHFVFNGIQSVLIVLGVSGPKPQITPEQVTSLVIPLIRVFHFLN
jgi:membrane protease YdiL (CAAX protease family)